METTEQLKLVMDCEVKALLADSSDQKKDFSAKDETDSSTTQKEIVDPLTHMPTGTSNNVMFTCSETSAGTVMPCQGQKEYLTLEPAHEENSNASVFSSVSDTFCSPNSVSENDIHLKEQETPEQDPEQEEQTEPNVGEPEIIVCHNHDEMDKCLTVEIAETSSESEIDEKWRTIFSSSINKEDDDSYLDSLQLSAQELFVHKSEVTDFDEQNNIFEEVHCEVHLGAEVRSQPENINSISIPLQEVNNNLLSLHGLSKISEDENDRDSKHNHTNAYQNIRADTINKLPKDFSVIQETKNENVSTEHLDFQLARKQWRQMEEQVKSKIGLPTTKQQSFHGGHNFMYTPVRNIQRTQKKGHDLQNLNLVWDYPHTQFSPCSEDSGLSDSSYRSPYDDPETPVEREMCISMKTESFRKERLVKSADGASSQRIPRSISTPSTTSFFVTTSSTKEPLKHNVSPHNVIILHPKNDFTCSPSHDDNTTTRSGNWCSEDSMSKLIIPEASNVIIRSTSEFFLNKACEQPQEKIFLNNPFFKLRSRSTVSLVDEEIKLVRQREEELRKERANLYGKDGLNAAKMLSNHMNTLAFDSSDDVPMKCKSSPSSPMKTFNSLDRSVQSCDERIPVVYTGVRRKSAMALRWEAGKFTKND
ncbi:uncharacterized protein FYW49_016994 [Xenentodon cancila]